MASTGFLFISPAEGAEVFGSSVSENKQHLLKEIICHFNKAQRSQRSVIVLTAAHVDDYTSKSRTPKLHQDA